MTRSLAHQSTPAVAGVDRIREAFPALERRHGDHPVAYFDGPGGTQVPRSVGEATLEYLYHHNANTHWQYPTSAETDELLAEARDVFRLFLGAGSPDDIVFGANMTTLTLHLARALGRGWGPGDEVVVTELDHHANIDPWRALEVERGVTVVPVRMRVEDGQLDWDHFERVVGPRTKLVAVGAASNALGTINDVPRAIELARTVGALTFVDAVHYVPHRLADVRAWGCDFLACSPYKFYGPHLGVLTADAFRLNRIDFPHLIPASSVAPERAESGTLDHEGIVGAAAAVTWLAGLSGTDGGLRDRLQATYDALHGRAATQFERMWEGLSGIDGVRLYGPPPGVPRTGTAAFTVQGLPASEVSRRLADRGLFTSHGDFYAYTVVQRLGLHPEGLVRVGLACYSTDEEVDRLVEAVRMLGAELRS